MQRECVPSSKLKAVQLNIITSDLFLARPVWHHLGPHCPPWSIVHLSLSAQSSVQQAAVNGGYKLTFKAASQFKSWLARHWSLEHRIWIITQPTSQPSYSTGR